MAQVQQRETKAIGAGPIGYDPVLELRLVFGYGQEPGQVSHQARADQAERTGELLPHQLRRGSPDLLDRAQLASSPVRLMVAEVQVVDADLLLELPGTRRAAGEDTEHDAIEVPHQVATHHMATRVVAVEARGEDQMGRADRATGQHDVPRSIHRSLTGTSIGADHLGYPIPLGQE